MKVFVLLGRFDYEGDQLLGVYSTRELAVSAKASFGFGGYHHYVVESREVDVYADPYDMAPTDYV